MNGHPQRFDTGSPPSGARRPIWAPDPGAPAAARILAYLFGGLMVLTVFVSNAAIRPADLPSAPKLWRTYTSTEFTMPYPDGWRAEAVPREDERYRRVYFFLPPDDYIRVEAIIIEESAPIRADDVDELTRNLEHKVRTEFSRYARKTASGSDGEAGEWHLFTARMKDATRRPITGAWLLKVQGTRALYLEAIAPNEGWPVMSGIFAAMSQNAVIAADAAR